MKNYCKLQFEIKFDRSKKFDLCYYGQVKSLRLKSSVASKLASKSFGGNIYFAGDGTLYSIILLHGFFFVKF